MNSQSFYILAIISSLMIINICYAEGDGHDIGHEANNNLDENGNHNVEEQRQQQKNHNDDGNPDSGDDYEDYENDEDDDEDEDKENGQQLINLDGGDEEDESKRIGEPANEESDDNPSDFATSPDTFEEGTDYDDEEGMLVG